MNLLAFLNFITSIVLLVALSAGEDETYQCMDLYEFDASKKGTVSSPFYGERERYHAGLWCEYRITAPKTHRIKITFKEMDITPSPGCREDSLSVFGKDKKSIFDVFCGSKLPFPILSKEGENEIRLLFRTHDGVSGKGFLLEYESGPDLVLCEANYTQCRNRNCYPNEKRCDGVDDCGDGSDEDDCHVIVDDKNPCSRVNSIDASKRGTLSSPFYAEREHYPEGLICEYLLTAPKNYRIKLTFKEMDIAPSDGCGQDRLTILAEDRSTSLGIFCGTQLPFPVISVKGENVLRVLFSTDDMVSGRGFLLDYESAPGLELCESGHTECTNRNCYQNKKKCDGVDDCGDGTDEEDCGFPIASNPKGCGIQTFQPNTIFHSADRMVGGESAVANSWPWQVSLQSTRSEPCSHFCGGTLLNSQWVLTASHCVAGFTEPRDIRIHLGSHNKFTRSPYEQIRRSAKVIGYPDLEGEKINHYDIIHDMSLIKLNAPIQFNDGVQPACLPSLGWELQSGSTCYVTGWGETRGTGSSDTLKQMDQVILPVNDCTRNNQTQICIAKKNNSPCHGDSGGPLHCRLGEKWYVFGVASYITTTNMMSGLCAGPGAISVYANVAAKIDWINKIIQQFG